MRRCTHALAAAAIAAAVGFAEPALADKHSDFLYSPSSSELNYRLFVPPNYDPSRSYPIIIYLHGSGELGTNNSSQLAELTNLYNKAKTDEYAAFILAPQAKPSTGAFQVYTEGAAMPLTMNVVDQLLAGQNTINPAQPGYNIDPSRVYLTGISLGSFGVWDSGAHYAGRFAALAPLGGSPSSYSGATATTAQTLVNHATPIWAFHGGDDQNTQAGNTRSMIHRMRSLGGAPLYSEFYKWTHGIWNKTYNENNFYEWMFNQSLNGPIQSPPPLPPRDPAKSVHETFDGTTLSPLLTDAAGNYNLVKLSHSFNQTSHRLVHTDNAQRTYVTTTNSLRDDDFIFELTVHTQEGGGGNGIAFIGFGSGMPDTSFYGEPTDSLAINLRPADWHAGRTTLNFNKTELASFGQYGEIHGGGRHRIQIVKEGDWLTFNLDRDYNGEMFFTDHTFTIDLGTLTLDDYKLFFGTASAFTTFEDLNLHVVQVPEPAMGMVALSALALLRRRRAPQSHPA